MNKEKIFFIICSFVIVMAITIYSVSSEKPDIKPVISTYTNSTTTKENIIIPTNTEKSELIINYPIDINFATKEELCSLEGIGDVLSEKIIEYRKEHYFYSVEDITKVSGIGKKFLDENKDKIFVDLSKLPEITTTYQNTTKTTTITSEISETTITTVLTPKETIIPEITSVIIVTTRTESEPKKELMPVNLNTATYEELTSLPISPEIAKQIIELRNEIGHFSSTRELCYIEGYNRELYDELLKYVYVE